MLITGSDFRRGGKYTEHTVKSENSTPKMRVLLTKICVLGLFCINIAMSQVAINTHPVDTTVDIGQIAVLFCSLTNRVVSQQVAWVKDGIIVSLNSETPAYTPTNSRYSVDASPISGDFNLVITDADPNEDTGIFNCFVPSSSAISTAAQLTVNFPPTDVYPRCSTPQAVYREGNVLNAVCLCGESQPIVDLTWTDGDKELPSILFVSSDGEVTSTYQRVITSADSSREFFCRLNHVLLSSTQVCKVGPLHIQYAPKNTRLFIMNDIVIGSVLTIVCNASANPEISEYEWVVPDSLSPNRFNILANILKIESIETSDNGTNISCTAVNTVGTGNAYHVIIIDGNMAVLGDLSTGLSAGASAAVILSVLLLTAFSIVLFCVFQKRKAATVEGRPAIEAHLESVLQKHVNSQRKRSFQEDRKLNDVEKDISTKGSMKPPRISKRSITEARQVEHDDSVNLYAIAPCVQTQTSYADDSETYAIVSPGHSGTQDPTNTPQTNLVNQRSPAPMGTKQGNTSPSVPSAVTKNVEGLTYADLDFGSVKTSSKSPVCVENTVYADVRT